MQVFKQSISSLKGNFFITLYTAGSRTKPCVVFIKVPVAVVDVVVEQLSCPDIDVNDFDNNDVNDFDVKCFDDE